MVEREISKANNLNNSEKKITEHKIRGGYNVG